MENKESYTPEEFQKGIVAYAKYKTNKLQYEYAKDNSEIGWQTIEASKNWINESVEECEKHIPKSLIDKLGIKKIQ